MGPSGSANTCVYKSGGVNCQPTWRLLRLVLKCLESDSLTVCQDLGKSYAIICRVLRHLQTPKTANFCTTYYSLLFQQSAKVARLVPIPEERVHALKIAVESALSLIMTVSIPYELALEGINQPCFQICEMIGLARPRAPILASCRQCWQETTHATPTPTPRPRESRGVSRGASRDDSQNASGTTFFRI